MEITFINTAVELLCREGRRATRELGSASAQKLQRRLAELFNAANVSELVAGRPHPLHGDKRGCFSVDLHGGDRLVFKPEVQPPPVKADGSIDWA
jgi:proteic killer suppression protein